MSANKKHLHLASRLWKKTAFQSMLEPGQQESENILDSFQDILHAYTAFEKSALQGIKQLKAIKLNLPALAKIRDELVGSRTRIQKFIEQETAIVSRVINELGEFRFMLQRSQLNASREYYEKIDQFLSSKQDRISIRRLEAIHEELKKLSKPEKLHVCSSPDSSDFEKWIASFYVRAEDFFFKAYRVEWQEEVQRKQIPFIRLKHERHFQPLFAPSQAQASIPGKQEESDDEPGCEEAVEIKRETDRMPLEIGMEEEQNDIVSQIFKEIAKPR